MGLLSSAEAFGFSSDNSSLTRSFGQMLVLPNQPVVVTAGFTNAGTKALRGFVYNEEVPSGFSVTTLRVTLNGQNVTNYTLESGQDGDVYAGCTPWRWLLESPAGFAQSNAIAPGAGVQIVYALSSSTPGWFSFPQFAWGGCDPTATNASFGYGETSRPQTLAVPGVSGREYVTNGDFEAWTATNTFLGWTEIDASKVTTNSTAFAGQNSARLLAASGATEFRQALAPAGQGTAAWLFNVDFACNQPVTVTNRSFGLSLNHLPLPATNGINLRVVDADTNGVGDVQVYNQSLSGWLTVLSNAVTFTTNFDTVAGLRVNHLQILGRYNQAIPNYDLTVRNASSVTNTALNQTGFQVAPPTNGNPVFVLDFGQNAYAPGSTAVVDNVSLVLLSPAVAMPATTNVQCASGVTLTAAASGPGPFGYQWFDARSNAIAGATASTLSLPAPQPGNYAVVVTNNYGTAAAVSTLGVIDTIPPAVVVLGANPWTNECHVLFVDSGATANDACAGGCAVITNGNVNPDVPGDYTISYSAADPSGNWATNTRLVRVVDTTPPSLALLGANPLLLAWGAPFSDPGATASDTCAGTLPVNLSGSVNTNAPGSYLLTYFATDPSGNIATAQRTVTVERPPPPVYTWGFTNLVLSANSNCQATMPDVTGTNFIQAHAMYNSAVTLSQMPTNGTILALGTNEVVVAVADGSGNVVFSTNWVVVADQTPPAIVLSGVTPMAVECHALFADPGCTASDTCSGIISLVTNGTVNPNLLGQYVLEYVALDGAGNAATNTRLIQVVDTTPPVITNCVPAQTVSAGYDGFGTLPDLAGLLVARDACSGTVRVVQDPPPGTRQPVGATVLVFSVDDGNGNTNTCATTVTIAAATLAPPVILTQGLLANGSFQLSFGGPQGQPYRVVASPDMALPMASWSVLTNGTFAAAAESYTDPLSAAQPARFYRIVSP